MSATVRGQGGGSVGVSVKSMCEGKCEPKHWAEVSAYLYPDPVLDAALVAQGAEPHDVRIIADRKSSTGRMMVYEDLDEALTKMNNGTTTRLITTWWEEGGDRYYLCEGHFASALGLAAALEKACSNAVVH